MPSVPKDLIDFAHRLADASGEVIRPYFRQALTVTDKETGRAGFDPVTIADQEAEAVIRKLIVETYPRHGILGEEHGAAQGEDPWTWVIDPIDGTRAFICGLPLWGTLIALNDGTRPVFGILDQPIMGERFFGSRDGAVLRTAQGERPLRTRECQRLADAVLTTTHPYAYFSEHEGAAFDALSHRVRMTRFGGDCYAYGLLALGFIDLVVEAALNPYDIQALIPIIEGAGGRVTNWRGRDAQSGGRAVAAGDPNLHAEALSLLSVIPD